MSETSTLTIVFRGLMIFHEDRKNNLMEIGFLRTPGHIPRILTITNGVLAGVFDLRNRPELGDLTQRKWRIDVTGPAPLGISLYTDGSKDMHRLTHQDDRDYRWIMDFEGRDFYNKELTDLKAQELMPVLQVPVGQFYTRLKAPSLLRREDDGPLNPFGAVAAVTGCDIQINEGGAKLSVVGGPTLFTFKRPGESIGNTIFEINNAPPDVPEALNGEAPHDEHGGLHHGPDHDDHFQNYYALFDEDKIPSPRFGFLAPDPSPNPDPALCGKGRVGTREDPLAE